MVPWSEGLRLFYKEFSFMGNNGKDFILILKFILIYTLPCDNSVYCEINKNWLTTLNEGKR